MIYHALAMLLLVASRPQRWLPAFERALASRRAPVVAGLVSALAIWYVLGSLTPTPVVHDEAAYLFQAQLFAAFEWTAPARPMPEFFEQFHVLVTPVTAAKYPPGFALALAPGVWLGAPALMLVILAGVSGALVFILARRISGNWVALLTVALWLAAPSGGVFRAGYFSEVLTLAVWLAGWMLLLRWRDDGRRRWLVALSALVAFGAIARPLTMVAYAIPVAAAVLWIAARRRAWADVAIAAAAGICVLGIVPLWSARTTGDWRTTPLAVYTEQYLPFDVPGFTVDSTPPVRAGAADMRAIFDMFLQEHADHAQAPMSGIYLPRMRKIAQAAYGSALWKPLAVVALVGVATAASVELLVAGAAALLLVLLYGAYAHPAPWTLYYVEAIPVLCIAAALGVGQLAKFGQRLRRTAADGVAALELRREITLYVTALVLVSAMLGTVAARQVRAGTSAGQAAFFDAVRGLPAPSIVFVRYAPGHNIHRSLIVNLPDLAAARAWIVHDRGDENARLLALAPARTPWIYDEATRTLTPLARAAAAPPNAESQRSAPAPSDTGRAPGSARTPD